MSYLQELLAVQARVPVVAAFPLCETMSAWLEMLRLSQMLPPKAAESLAANAKVCGKGTCPTTSNRSTDNTPHV